MSMNKEILLVVDSVSNEKGVEKEAIFGAIESALASITAKRYKEEVEIRVAIDRDSGDYETFRQWTVVVDPEEGGEEAGGEEENGEEEGGEGESGAFEPEKHITLVEAKKLDPELEIGDTVEEAIESVEFGRIAARQAMQVIQRELRKAERDEIARQYQEKIGKVLVGVVKSVTRDSVILDMGDNAEALLPKEALIPREPVRIGDRMRAVLIKVAEERKGPQLLMSRTRPEMLMELFRMEVPEINEEVIEIKAAARDSGSRAKIAVKTNDGRIDPIGACVGIRGSRVQAVSGELNGERIDIILWSDDPAQLVVNAMSPAEITSITVDEDVHSMDIAVPEDQLAQAIGRSGQNVQLASELSGWTLNVMTAAEVEKRHKEKTSDLIKIFTEALDVDEDLAEVLGQEGFNSLDDIVNATDEDLLAIEGFDEDLAEELRNRARDNLLSQVLDDEAEVGTVEPAQDLLELEGMTRHLAYILASRKIVTREDLAECAVDELADIEDLSEELAAKIIMAARAHWFE